MFDVVRNARRAAAGAPSLPRSTQPDPLLALDAEHREVLAAVKAIGAGSPEFEAAGERQTDVDETSDIGDIGGTIDFVHDAIEAIERFAA